MLDLLRNSINHRVRREFRLEGNEIVRLNGKYKGVVTRYQIRFEGKDYGRQRIIDILKTPS